MKDILKKALKFVIPAKILTLRQHYNDLKSLENWHIEGCVVPAPHILKQLTIKEYKKKFGYNILIETGTWLGHMIDAQKKYFKKIISIELDLNFFTNAKNKFKNNSNVEIIHGDSGKVLKNILENITEPVIFWLDGHYVWGNAEKGELLCPIYEELDSIFSSSLKNFILLIDDARFFIGKDDYPSIEDLKKHIESKDRKFDFLIKDDLIRVVV